LVAENDASINNDAISGLSIRSMIKSELKKRAGPVDYSKSKRNDDALVEELRNFGIDTNSKFAEAISSFPIEKLPKGYDTSDIGLARDIMLFLNPEKYLEDCYRDQFTFSEDDVKDIERLSGKGFRNLLERKNIEWRT
jgi:hypothetical protein